MSYGTYTSLDSLAANGIINFDANAYLTGAPPRYIGKPYGDNYLPFEQPLMNMPSPYGMAYGMGYGMGYAPYGYPPAWRDVTPSMHAQPTHDQFAPSRPHNNKQSLKEWGAALSIAALGTWAVVKLANRNAARAAKAKAKAAAAATTAATTATTTAAATATETPAAAKKGSKFINFFKSLYKKTPKWVKITGLTLAGLYAGYKLLVARAKKNYAKRMQQAQLQQMQAQQMQQAQQPQGSVQPVIPQPENVQSVLPEQEQMQPQQEAVQQFPPQPQE